MHRYRDSMADDLHDQIASLSSEVADLRRQMSRKSARAYHDTRNMGAEFGEMLREYVSAALPEIRRNAHRLERTARDNPAASAGVAAAGLVAIGLAATFFLRR
ncbi:hypothetical protein [Nitratireductor sp. CH_MIT9313-5]|jgi:urease accessory protein UreF|uniref:hypothetical protein n=1 Tax=Nitratireductor sp. CH_MIT9313-5 TaxID=3107764 RepID=UPI003009604D